MKFTMRFDGGEDLARHLDSLRDAVSRKVKLDALKKAAEPVRERSSALAPRGDSGAPHLADDIVVAIVSSRGLDVMDRGDDAAVEVGPSYKPEDHFYGYYQEHGTAFHGAQAFMRPGFDSGAPAALGVLGAELWAAIRKALPTSFGSSRSGGGVGV